MLIYRSLSWGGGGRKSLSIAKNWPKPSQEFSEQFRPFIHIMKGLSRNSPQKLRTCPPGRKSVRASGPKLEKIRQETDFGLTAKIGEKSPRNWKNGPKNSLKKWVFGPFFRFLGGQTPFFSDFSYFGPEARTDYLPGGHVRNPKSSRELRPKTWEDRFLGIPFLGDKIQGPFWGQQKRRKPPLWHLLDPRFEWLEVA